MSTRHRATGAGLIAAMLVFSLGGVFARPLGDSSDEPAPLLPAAIGDLFARLDANHDDRLSADELTPVLRSAIDRIDLDHDGYVRRSELELALRADALRTAAQGEVIANRIVTVADDFIVDVYHNGVRVPDSKRTLREEIFGATVETIDIEVRRGDWLVFNVVNNRLRWGGARYFAAAGIKEGAGTTFTTEPHTGQWTRCDEPSQAAAFIADSRYLDQQPARPIDTPWDRGDSLMTQYADGWQGTAIWGDSRNTWLRFVAR